MLTDPEAWFLTSKALDHHTTVEVLRQAMPRDVPFADDTAQQIAVALATSGYALVGLDPEHPPANDLTDQLESFLNRRED